MLLSSSRVSKLIRAVTACSEALAALRFREEYPYIFSSCGVKLLIFPQLGDCFNSIRL